MRGGTILYALTQEPDGALSGLTVLAALPGEDAFVRQWMTGVGRAYRGRGLGKWVKAANLLRVRQELPEVRHVLTGNATVNEGMLAINVGLGFYPHREGIEAQITLEALERYLGR